ncbi:hypothetical protein ZIOFF_062706 [Zingiber officinale]|uniref:Uncharacterized protein n=1 Tax=Zingiber officinale TaxID=94328 RepID=A0A8J5F5F4_ZINOF|nr:hypothetical protein ZIOFF_062706 [Zingiber officinale]
MEGFSSTVPHLRHSIFPSTNLPILSPSSLCPRFADAESRATSIFLDPSPLLTSLDAVLPVDIARSHQREHAQESGNLILKIPAAIPNSSHLGNSRHQHSAQKDVEPSIPLPFPQCKIQPRKNVEEEKAKEFQELVNLFSKVEVNVPLLTMIKQIPKYAKFLKDLCVHKKKLKGNKLVSLGKNVSAFIQPVPQKCEDPGVFTVPCEIGSSLFEDAMLDLGASKNVMPRSVFHTLGIGPL